MYICRYGIEFHICKVMITRHLQNKIIELSGKFPIVSIIGPRQAGKTTLAKVCFPRYAYVNLESPDIRLFAQSDPKAFLKQFTQGVIIDEVQYVPDLFSYIQVIVDEIQKEGMFILTGSQNFNLLEQLSQSLAGRVALFTLLPFSLAELTAHFSLKPSYSMYILHGMYPRLWDKHIAPVDYYPQYIKTYLERDVRMIKNISNSILFTKFLHIIAGRAGQILNYTSIANDLGVDVKTIQSWVSVLEASYIVFLLPVFHKNYNKRIIKAPKLYFYDTGLLCSLLQISNQELFDIHQFKGNIFENFIITELKKHIINHSLPYTMYYWRDSTGNEIDCIIDNGFDQTIIEIKSSSTIHQDFFKSIEKYQVLSQTSPENSYLIYGDSEKQIRSSAKVLPWNEAINCIPKL